MQRLLSILVLALTFVAAGPAQAATFELSAVIDGPQAGTPSAATGSATMTYDDVTGLFSWNIVWGPLEGTITVAHFHGPAAPGMGAGVQVNFGSISGLNSPSIGSATISAAQAADLLAGLWYINIHSSPNFLGGEIRGQVGVVNDFAYSGDATICTGTCDSFAALGGPGGAINTTPSTLSGLITIINAGPGASFSFADVDPNIDFEVLNTAAPLEAAIFAPDPDPRCNGRPLGELCNAVSANPLPLNSDIAVLRPSEPTQGSVTAGTIDAAGNLDTGTLLLEFIVPPFNNNSAWAILDLATGSAQVCLFYANSGCIPGATEAVVFAGSWSIASPDTDGDGVADNTDNCINVANANQRDTNGDGHGNACDADLNNDCIVNPVDLGIFRSVFFTANADADFNGDGIVNPVDLGIFRSLFFQPPGPSAAGACTP